MTASQRMILFAVALGILSIALTGCGYVKNVRDDFADIFILGAGITPPVATAQGETYVGSFFPPSFGLFGQVTEFLQLGFIGKVSVDAEIDRRGMGLVADRRLKWGVLFIRGTYIDQTPLWTNLYLREGNELDPWRAYMYNVSDVILHQPAKRLIYREYAPPTVWSWSRLERGWQGWETVEVELALPEPFIFHSGFNLRVGVDVSEAFDFLLSLFCLDLYGDRAYEYGSGRVRKFPQVYVLPSGETEMRSVLPPETIQTVGPYGDSSFYLRP